MPVRACAHSVIDARISATSFKYNFMRQPLHGNRLDERIGNEHFLLALRRRVAVISRLNVRLQHCPQARQAAEKFHVRRCATAGASFFGKSAGDWYSRLYANFVLQRAQHRIEHSAVTTLISEEWMSFLVEISGNSSRSKSCGDGGDGAFGRQIFAVKWLMPAHARIRRGRAGL